MGQFSHGERHRKECSNEVHFLLLFMSTSSLRSNVNLFSAVVNVELAVTQTDFYRVSRSVTTSI